MAETAATGVREIAKEARPVVEIFSTYMKNISHDVLDAQNQCVRKFLPAGWRFTQALTQVSHAECLQRCTQMTDADVVMFLDIDCVPINSAALPHLFQHASAGKLVGAAQRANHKNNGGHLYVGPFCMAFSRAKYFALGSPTFDETPRGDIGEELTYVWDEVVMLRPTSVTTSVWDLDAGQMFGYGTTYQDMFYHEFCSRITQHQTAFVNKCRNALQEKS